MVRATDERRAEALLGTTAGPKSLSSWNSLLASAKTIFGRAFHGLNRASVEE